MNFNASVFVLLASIIFPLTLVVTYSVSLSNKHIVPIWPYISHTGNEPNESCYFSLGVNIVAGLYALIVYLRYSQLKDYLSPTPNKLRSFVNKSALIWGTVAAVALSMVAGIQQHNVGFAHVASAVACSYSALVYFWHQTLFCHMIPGLTSRRLKIFRTVLSVLSTVLHAAAPCLYMYTLIKHPMPQGKVTEWSSRDGKSMGIYLAGSLMEWSVFTLNEIYVASFYGEFRRIRFKTGELLFIEHEH